MKISIQGVTQGSFRLLTVEDLGEYNEYTYESEEPGGIQQVRISVLKSDDMLAEHAASE